MPDAGGDALDGQRLVGLDRPLAVDRAAQRVHHAPDEAVADRDGRDAARAAHFVALVDPGVLAHDDDADVVHFEVERHSQDAILKLDKLLSAHALQPDDARDPIPHLDDGPHIDGAALALKACDLLQQTPGNIAGHFRH